MALKVIIIGWRTNDDIMRALAARRLAAAAERCMVLMAKASAVDAERAFRKVGRALRNLQMEPTKIPGPPPEIVDKAPYYNQFRKKSWR